MGVMSGGNDAIGELPGAYRRAFRLAWLGRLDQARRLYAQIDASADPRLRSLVASDLAVLDAMAGDLGSARASFRAVLAADGSCEPARLNAALLDTEPPPPRRARAPLARSHRRAIPGAARFAWRS
jgi:hypothetical protein